MPDPIATSADVIWYEGSLPMSVVALVSINSGRIEWNNDMRSWMRKVGIHLVRQLAVHRPCAIQTHIPLTICYVLMLIRQRLMCSLHARAFGVVAHLTVHTQSGHPRVRCSPRTGWAPMGGHPHIIARSTPLHILRVYYTVS